MNILTTIRENLSPARVIVLAFTVAYTVAAGIFFSLTGNTEFLGYIAVIVFLLVFFGCFLTHQCVPVWLFWMLSSVGLLHMLGAAIPVGGDILYNYVPFPIDNPTGLTIIKFDQIVHTYASGVAAVLMYFFLARDTRFHWLGILVFSVLGSIGLGSINEVIEFLAKVSVPNTDVGGYYNTAMDLVVNLVGAIIGATVCLKFWKRLPA